MLGITRKLFRTIVLGNILSIVLSGITYGQTNITGVPGYTTIETQPGSGTYHIRSSKVINNGEAVLNRFTCFYLDTNNTANIYLGTDNGIAQTAINVVNNSLGNPTTINGLLKLVAGNNEFHPTGGNLIFVDPNGIIVGQNGSINAGSILLTTSSKTYAQLNGNPTEINLNDMSKDNLLNTQSININGKYRFNSITGIVGIEGELNTLNADSPVGINPGVSIYSKNINITTNGKIITNKNNNINLITGKDVSWNASSNVVTVPTPLANDGNISIAGNINSSEGNILAMVNTTDLINNIINLTGVINASSLQNNTYSGSVVLDVPNLTTESNESGISIVSQGMPPQPTQWKTHLGSSFFCCLRSVCPKHNINIVY